MSIVRFAHICDRCGNRSEEYTPFATCRDCGDDVCPKCSVDPSEDERNLATCLKCKDERESASEPESELEEARRTRG